MSELLVEEADEIAVLTLNRPSHNNSITNQILARLRDVIPELEANGTTRAVVIKGSNDIFSAGFDISPTPGGPADSAGQRRKRVRDHADLASEAFWRVWRSPLPFIVAAERMCLGGAVYFSAVCDYMLVSPETEIGMIELKLGLVPPLFNIFPWIMSYRHAKSFLLTGEVVDGVRAVEIGLASRCVPAGDVVAEAMTLAGRLAAMPDDVVAQVKRSVNRRWEVSGLVGEVEAGVDAFVQDKVNMRRFQRNFRRISDEQGVGPAITQLGIELGLREPYSQ